MRHDLWKIALAIALGTLAGYLFANAMLGALVAALGVIAWQLRRFRKLYRWVKNPKDHTLAESTGQLYQLHRELSRRANTSKLRKQQLGDLFSQFRQAVSVLPDAIVLIDANGQIRWANYNAEQLFGIRWPADAHVRFGNLVRDPKLVQLLAKSNDELRIPIENKPAFGVEIKTHDGERILNVKVLPYTDDLRMVLARDITRLMKVNQMRTDFVANVSHELKTPLTVLRGYLEILQGNPKLEASLKRPIDQMALQSKRMEMIVQDLLFLSKLEEPHEPTKHETIDVTQLLNSIIEMIQPKVSERAHKLELDIDYKLHVLGNPNELHSAFSNLIVNAVNYTPANGFIKLRWQRNDQGAAFTIKDNGRGIAPIHLPRLTERFYRIDADRSREGGGTGLGLAIVKHVLQRHNAQLEIDSEEGSGSTFTCQFPSRQIVEVGSHRDQQAG